MPPVAGTSTPVIDPEIQKKFGHLTGKALSDALIADFRDRKLFSKQYEDSLQKRIEETQKKGGEARVLELYSVVDKMLGRRAQLEKQSHGVDLERKRYRQDAGAIKPSDLGKEAFRTMQYKGVGPLFNHKPLLGNYRQNVEVDYDSLSQEEQKKLSEGGYQGEVLAMRANKHDTPYRYGSDRVYGGKLKEATKQVKKLLKRSSTTMKHLLEGDYDWRPYDALRALEEKERKINRGKSSLAHGAELLSEPFSGQAKWLGKALGVYDGDPKKDSRYQRHLRDYRRLSEGASGLYLRDRARFNPALDKALRRLASMGANYEMSEKEFEDIFKDLMDAFRKEEGAQDALKQGIINNFEKEVLNANKGLFGNISDDVKAKQVINLYRILVVASLLIPFVAPGLAILPNLSNFLSPFMQTDLAHAFGEIAASEHTGIFGDIGGVIHLDEAITWFLEKCPGISQLLDLISSILQSGLVQDTAKIIAPILNSPLPDIALGVGFALARVKPELDRYEKITKQVKDAREHLKSSYANLADSLDKHANESAKALSEALISATKKAAKRSMIAGLLESLVERIPAGSDHTCQEAKDIINLVKAVYKKEDEAFRALEVMGFSFKDDPTNPKNKICNGFSKTTIQELQKELSDEDVSQMAALVYTLDHKIIEDYFNLTKPLPRPLTLRETMQREVDISRYHDELHKYRDNYAVPNAENMLEKRINYLAGLSSSDLQNLASELKSKPAEREFAKQGGEGFLNYVAIAEIAKERWGINPDRYNNRSMREADSALNDRVCSLERGVLESRNTHNILRAPSHSPAPASSLPVSPPVPPRAP